MKKNVLLLTCLAVALSCHSCNSKGGADATPPDVVPNDTARYDVTAYVSNAARSMVFWKTGVSYSDKPNMSPRTISLHPDERYQEIDGFGAAITGSSAYNLLKMEAAARAKFLKETFDPTDGIGYSYVRVSIGASDEGDTELQPQPEGYGFALDLPPLDEGNGQGRLHAPQLVDKRAPQHSLLPGLCDLLREVDRGV